MRHAKPGDLPDILSFLQNANDPNVLSRPEEDYSRAVENGLFYLIEVNRQLVAAAGVFFLNEQDQGPMEMGSCYVAPAARGFGLQKLLVLPRIAAATIFFDETAPIYTAIKPDNPASLKSVTDMGFDRFREHEPLLIEPCAACNYRPGHASGRICCCDFFYMPLQKRCSAIRRLLSSSTVVLENKTSDRMIVTMDIQLLTIEDYRGALEEFSESDNCRG